MTTAGWIFMTPSFTWQAMPGSHMHSVRRAVGLNGCLAAGLVERGQGGGERLGVFCHGRAVTLTPADPFWDLTIAHWTQHYGTDPTTWGEDIRMFRIEPAWLVGYGAPDPDAV